MNLINIKNRSEMFKKLKNPLYKSSFYILLATLLNAIFGFIFWIIAAKLYSKEDLGVGVVIVSTMGIINLISLLGFDQSIIRFLPEGKKKTKFMTSIIIIFIFSAILSIVLLLNVNIIAPKIAMITDHPVLFSIFIMISPILILISSTFLSIRKAENYFLQTLLTGTRLILLIPLAIFGALGIFYSVGIGYMIAFVVSLMFLAKFGLLGNPKINRGYLKESFNFSSANYLNNLLTSLPNQILPIIVLNILGASVTANYYMAFTISSLLFLIPSSFSTSLFVEGSHGKSLKRNTLNSLIGITLLLIPAVLILYIFGGFFLGIIGKNYVEGLNLLRILVLSSFFVSIYQIFFSIKKVQKDIRVLIFISGINFFLIICLSYIFMLKFGMIGIGYGWFISYFISSVIIGLIIKNNRWIKW